MHLIKKEERFQINNITFHLKKIEKERQSEDKADESTNRE